MLKSCLRVIAFGVLVVAWASREECIPMAVTNVNLSFTGILSWSVREEDTCLISHFLVELAPPNGEKLFWFETEDPQINIDFLKPCEEWHVNIVAYSNTTKGDDHLYITQMPVPMDVDLIVNYFNVTHKKEEGDLDLEWSMEDIMWGDCSLKYRLTVSGDDGDVISDLYMKEKHAELHFLSPCVHYEFGVRVVNVAPPVMEGPMKSIEYDYPPAVQQRPVLEAASLGATTTNLTFSLETAQRNRCPIREFHVDGGKYLNLTIPLRDSDDREQVEVHLTSLLPNTMYTIKAKVQNSAGWSDDSVIAFQTLDVDPQ
ncbi:hypothetical protein NQ315_001364 [Exocentrus adspersus]|uniref:Fibronectin type-III domain-containing protein n=1 Tax=Exocentrus adspersus TaxID=1586481 RepID=A0AAV8WEY1_9CUCU|nr:hypothetical protein NQ315_001364 [Exocentrus adspersus]